MRYNLTSETYLTDTQSNFPGADSMSIEDILIATIYISMPPALIDFVLMTFIYNVPNKVKTISPTNILWGAILHFPIALFWMISLVQDGNNSASIISVILSFIVAMIVYRLIKGTVPNNG